MRHEQGTSQGDGRAAKANTYIGICAGGDYQDPEEISGVDFRPSRARRSRCSGRYDLKIQKGKSPKSPPATRRDNAARAGVSATGPSLVRILRGWGLRHAPWHPVARGHVHLAGTTFTQEEKLSERGSVRDKIKSPHFVAYEKTSTCLRDHGPAPPPNGLIPSASGTRLSPHTLWRVRNVHLPP